MPRCSSALLALCLAVPASSQLSSDRQALIARIDAQSSRFGELSRKIWELAEVGYQEKESSALLEAELRQAGFTLQTGVAEIPTAFVARWGTGKPVIGILGEYDALPGLSQQDVPVQKPRTPGAAGHGCGHNLLGTASALAAISVRNYLTEHHLPGTIVFFGTPAEEGGAGKVFMARAGVFQGVDAVIAWHPGTANEVNNRGSLANINARFRFAGKAAHAAVSPEQGRSALDGVMLTNFCVEMMREHVPQETRMHYVISDGGAAPNVVPASAEVFLYARHPSMPVLDGIWQRIEKCAQAGALGTETLVKETIVGSVYDMLPNPVIGALLERNVRAVGPVRYNTEEQAFAEALKTTLPPSESTGGLASTDVGDVSWLVPTAELTAATYVLGTPAHSWQSTACAGTSIGRKGMMIAAKAMALTALDLLESPEKVTEAQAALVKARAGREYRSRIPAASGPPLNYRQTGAR